MTFSVKVFVSAKLMENTQTTQYTATNCRATVDAFTVTNTSAGNAVFSVNLVPVGQTAGASNIIIDERAVAPGETYTCPEMIGQNFNPGDFLSTLAGAASALVFRVSGREIT
jgi:hypothetical protein